MKRILIAGDGILLNKTPAYNLTSDGYDIIPAQNAGLLGAFIRKRCN